MTAAVPCLGIQHTHLALHGQDDSIRSLCLEKWVYICRRWHSKDCQFVVDPGSKKQRCVKCANACSNIKKSRHPQLYPSSTPISPTPIADTSPEPNQPAVSIGDLILPNEDALRQRAKELIDSIGEYKNLSDNDEILLMAKVLKLKGKIVFDLDENRAFVVCVGNECNACFVRKKRANISTSCKRCIVKKYDDKRNGARKEAHKELRVAAKSKVPFSALDDKEQTDRLSNMRLERQYKNRDFKRAAVKLGKKEEKFLIAEQTLKHMKKPWKSWRLKNHHKKD